MPDTFRPPRPAVLRDVGGDGGGDALFRRKGEVIHPRDGVERRDGPHAQGVDLALDQHFADGLHRLLQRRDRPVLQDAPQQRRANAPVLPGGAKLRHPPHHVDGGHQGAGGLGHHGRHGAAHDPEPQPADEDEVQRRVEHGGKGQKFEGRFRIPHAFKARRQRVVKEGEGRAQKGDAQIHAGDGKNAVRHRQRTQDRRRTCHAQQRHGAAKRRAEQQRGSQRLPQRAGLPCAEGFAHEHPRADAQPADRQDHQVHHRSGHALGGQGILPNEPPGDDGVHRIISQLQPVAQQQRHRIKEEVPQRGTLGHIAHRLRALSLIGSRPLLPSQRRRWSGSNLPAGRPAYSGTPLSRTVPGSARRNTS